MGTKFSRPYLECKAYASSGADVPDEQAGNHLRFEAASPSFWCPRGYAIVYWDERGTSQSPGVLENFAGQHFDGSCFTCLIFVYTILPDC